MHAIIPHFVTVELFGSVLVVIILGELEQTGGQVRPPSQASPCLHLQSDSVLSRCALQVYAWSPGSRPPPSRANVYFISSWGYTATPGNYI